VELTPAVYECPMHHVDLTPQVLAVLEGEGLPVAYGDRTFRVPVCCPGDGTSGPHALMCSGRFRR
jgi:hypothetical protein